MAEKPKMDTARIKRIINPKDYDCEFSEDEYYSIYKFGGFEVAVRIFVRHLEFWVSDSGASWVEVSVPIPAPFNAHCSRCMKWCFEKIVEQQKAKA